MGISNQLFPRANFCSRRSFMQAVFATVAISQATISRGSARRETVLFICQYGSVKSAITRELFRRRALERGVQVTAISRGIALESHLAPQLRATLAVDGIDPERDGQHQLTKADLHYANMTVILDPLPKDWKAKRIHDWTDIRSFNQFYESEKPRVLARIDQLLDEIVAQTHHR